METLTPSISKLPIELAICIKCNYEHFASQMVDGLCPSCHRDREHAKNLLKEQQEHPEGLLSRWGVPKKHLNSSFENYQDGDKVKEFLITASKGPESVLLSGKTGCGKTHLAVAMLRGKIERATKPFNEYRTTRQTIFITVPELLFEIRQTFNNKDSGDTEQTLVDKYSEAPLLILDDLGAEKTTDWAESTLYLIIDRRNRDEKWTIVTSNLTLQEIEHSLGARIASRLADMKIVNIKLPDYRKKREQQKSVGL